MAWMHRSSARILALAALAAAAAGLGAACAGGPARTPAAVQPAPAPTPRPPASGEPGGAAPAPAPAPSAEAEPREGAGHGFPTPEQLEQLGDTPAPDVFSPDVRPVDEWTLAGPFPAQVGAIPRAPGNVWEELLGDVVQSRAGLVVPTEAMTCMAREVGLFYLAQGGLPDDGLRRFMTSRCQASVSQVAFGYLDGPAPDSLPEERIYAGWEQGLRQTLEHSVAGGPRTVGIWFGRSGGHAVAMVATGRRDLHIEPFSPFADAKGRVEIRGEVLVPAVGVSALVNRGAYGVAPCSADTELAPPRFDFVCEVDRRDAWTHVALGVTPPDRLLSRAGLTVLVWPSRRTLDVYRAPRLDAPHPARDLASIPADLVALLNDVRTKAGLAPVALDETQSQVAAELAPHFFSAMFARSPDVHADLVALGMIAGWGVDGIVETGHFAAGWVVRSTDLGRLLAQAIDYPVSREALLAPEIDRIAVGPVLDTTPGAEAVAAVFGTYSLFAAESHDAFAARVYDKLAAERKAKGAGAPARLDELSGLCQEAASSVQGGMDPQDAMSVLLQRSVQVLRRPASGWMAEVRDLDDLEFPAEYLTDPTFSLAISVSHRRPAGEPWGRYVVMLVVADPQQWGT